MEKLIKQKERPFCERCKRNPCKRNGVTKLGIIKYKKYCSFCDKVIYNGKSHSKDSRKLGYTLHKNANCQNCGFIPVHSCQLDVDHIDGDKFNNEPLNLKTLCANCHRLKTFLSKNKKPD
jgi:hypothetical protein